MLFTKAHHKLPQQKNICYRLICYDSKFYLLKQHVSIRALIITILIIINYIILIIITIILIRNNNILFKKKKKKDFSPIVPKSLQSELGLNLRPLSSLPSYLYLSYYLICLNNLGIPTICVFRCFLMHSLGRLTINYFRHYFSYVIVAIVNASLIFPNGIAYCRKMSGIFPIFHCN